METPNSSFWKDKNVLVTGADGFAGSHLCEELLGKGCKVRGFVPSTNYRNLTSLSKVNFHVGDMLDYHSLQEATEQVDVIFHLAAITVIPETRAKITSTLAVNTDGTLNILLAAKENGVKKIVYVSTCHVYGKQNKIPISEENIPVPMDIYSASKLSAEHLCQAFIEMFDLDISISRAFNHYGSRQRKEFLIPTVITKLLKSKTADFGNPNPTRDFNYVSDIVKGYLLLAEYGKQGEIYNFGSGIERSVKDIVNDIVRIGGFEAEIQFDAEARKVDIPRSVGDSSKARKELGWVPEVSFDEGLAKTISWYKQMLGSQ